MSEIKPIIGICLDMCPQNEIKWWDNCLILLLIIYKILIFWSILLSNNRREENGLLHEFEIIKESDLNTIKDYNNCDKKSVFL